MRHSCVIFDCDGTLVDKREDIAAATNRALALHGFPDVPIENFGAMMGRGIMKLAFLALPEAARTEENIQAVAADSQRLYYEEPVKKSKPYPGIEDLLVRLREKKIKTAVMSNKPAEVLRRVIDSLFPRGSFDAIHGVQFDSGLKPDPSVVWDLLVELDRSPHETIFVGDTEIDMEIALSAGCYPMGVSWGFRTREALEQAGAASVIDSPDQIWEIVRRK